MRITLTIDDDLANALDALARNSGKPFADEVNEAIRRGLSAGGPRVSRERFRVQSARRGFQPGVDPTRLGRLLDELAVDEFLERSQVNDPKTSTEC